MPPMQPAAADRHEERLEARRLVRQLRADGALPEKGLGLVERVHRGRARVARRSLARRQRVGVPRPRRPRGPRRSRGSARSSRARRPSARRSSRGDAQAHRRVRDRGAVVAARGRDDAGRRDLAQQQVGERAARLEGPGVLERLELERQRKRREPEVRAARLDGRRPADVRPDDVVGGRMAARSIRLVMAGRILTEAVAPRFSKALSRYAHEETLRQPPSPRGRGSG